MKIAQRFSAGNKDIKPVKSRQGGKKRCDTVLDTCWLEVTGLPSLTGLDLLGEAFNPALKRWAIVMYDVVKNGRLLPFRKIEIAAHRD